MFGDKMQIAPNAQKYLPRTKNKAAGVAPGLESNGSGKETSRPKNRR